jgi:methyltransferase family protein
MKLEPATLDYLHGRRFSNDASFALGNRGRAPRRVDRLVQMARGQRVLHVGCCDHLPHVRERMARGTHLHQLLCGVAGHCVGVDTNLEGLSLLRELGFAEVYAPPDVPEQDFDLCLLADVIEHVGDPVAFLRSMARHRFGQLVITTPNVFRWRNCLPGSERVNSDHRYWFSPYTLCKVLVDAGYEPLGVELCHGDHVSLLGAVAARALDFVPRWRDTLLVRAQP